MDQTTKDELLNFATLHDLYGKPPDEVAKYHDKRGPRDFWIISHWPHVEHVKLGFAMGELRRLREQFPDKEFRIYHCKLRLGRSSARETILRLCDVIDSLLAPHDRGAPISHRMQKARKAVNHCRGVPQKTTGDAG